MRRDSLENETHLDVALGQVVGSVHVLFQIQIQEFKDQVQLAIVVDYVQESNNIWVLQLLQEGDFTDSGGRDTLVLGFQADFLESDCWRMVRGREGVQREECNVRSAVYVETAQ